MCPVASVLTVFLIVRTLEFRALLNISHSNRLDVIRRSFMLTMEFIIFLLCLSLVLWGTFCGWLARGKKYGISFFCALVQTIVLLGYAGISICDRLGKGEAIGYTIGTAIIIINWIVCFCVGITSMLATINYGRKHDKITLGLSVWQGLCYFWIFFIYQVWASC